MIMSIDPVDTQQLSKDCPILLFDITSDYRNTWKWFLLRPYLYLESENFRTFSWCKVLESVSN